MRYFKIAHNHIYCIIKNPVENSLMIKGEITTIDISDNTLEVVTDDSILKAFFVELTKEKFKEMLQNSLKQQESELDRMTKKLEAKRDLINKVLNDELLEN